MEDVDGDFETVVLLRYDLRRSYIIDAQAIALSLLHTHTHTHTYTYTLPPSLPLLSFSLSSPSLPTIDQMLQLPSSILQLLV